MLKISYNKRHMKKRDKKGFVFTLMVLLLFSSVFIISTVYLNRNLSNQNFISKTIEGNRLKFIRENVVSDFYSILNIKLREVKRSEGAVKIQFDNFSYFKKNSGYLARLLEYESFIENDYALMLNSPIRLENFLPIFYIYPYNSTFKLDNDQMYLYVNDIDSLRNISIDIYSNFTDYSNTTEPDNDSSDDPVIKIRVFDYDNNLNYEGKRNLDSYEEGNDFYIRYGNHSNITVEYGKHRRIRYYGHDILTNGTFYIKATNMTIRLNNLTIWMDNTSKKVILKAKSYLSLD